MTVYPVPTPQRPPDRSVSLLQNRSERTSVGGGRTVGTAIYNGVHEDSEERPTSNHVCTVGFARGLVRSKGFTLMEVLVVLVIVGMVTTLLFQAVGQISQMHSALKREVDTMRSQDLEAEWFRQIILGLIPDFREGRDHFKGQAREMKGLTTNAVGSNYGALTAFQLTLTFSQEQAQTELHFITPAKNLLLSTWPGNTGFLTYFDAKGEPHDQWPPALGQHSALPKTISLTRPGKDNDLTWFGAIVASDKPLPRVRDIFGGLR